VDLLNLFRNFYNIDQETYDLLAAEFTTRTFARGSFLLRAGEIPRNFYFVSKGVQKCYFETGGKQQVLNFTYAPFPCVVPASYLLQKPSSCYLKCLNVSELFCISFESLQLLFDKSTQIERLLEK
jgi:CRP-like cAMP-binding protein